MKIAGKTLKFTLVLVLILLLAAIIKTYTISSRQVKIVGRQSDYKAVDSVYERLGAAIRIPTVTPAKPETRDTAAFLAFHRYIYENYPLVQSKLERQLVNGLSLLYKWEGKNPDSQPFLLMAHLDVVPAEGDWEVEPFSGKRYGGYIYGRGALDIKSGVLGILEAVESLLKDGYVPERTVYLAFGHDEESGRGEGAAATADLLHKNGVELEFVLDEGGLILNHALPGLDNPVALVGIAEKGFVNLKISAYGTVGHSSMPDKETAVTRLAKAINAVSEHPMPVKIEGPVEKLFEFAAPEMNFPMNVIFTNPWLFGSVIKSQMTPSGNAALRTTIAFTMLEGSKKENTIPAVASVSANVRLMPGTDVRQLIGHLQDVINDTRVKIEVIPPVVPASGVSSADAPGFINIQKAVSEIMPEAVTAPFLLVAITDSRHYQKIAKNIYRFHPAIYEKEDLKRLHGENERISEKNYEKVVKFYRSIIYYSNNQ